MTLLNKIENIKNQLESFSRELDNLHDEIMSVGGSETKNGDNQMNDMVAHIQCYLALSPQIEEDSFLKMILQCAMHTVNAGGAGLTLLKEDKKNLVFKAAIGDGAEGIIGYEVPIKGSRHGEALLTGEVISSTPVHTAIEDKAKAAFRNVLVAPLIVEGDAVGTMSAVNKQDGDHFTPKDMEAYRLFADLAALVVRQRLREQVLEHLMKGGIEIVPDELKNVTCGKEDAGLLDVLQQVVRLSRKRDDMLPLFKQLISLFLEISSRFNLSR